MKAKIIGITNPSFSMKLGKNLELRRENTKTITGNWIDNLPLAQIQYENKIGTYSFQVKSPAFCVFNGDKSTRRDLLRDGDTFIIKHNGRSKKFKFVFDNDISLGNDIPNPEANLRKRVPSIKI